MSRVANIDFQRTTFSLPKKTITLLREKIEKNSMSKYVANLIEKDLRKEDYHDVDEFIEDLKNFRKNAVQKDKRNSLEILREIRYGEDA